MNYIIKFFENLNLTYVGDNMEFECCYEIITIREYNNSYLMYFHKTSAMFKSNLCQEILLLTEDIADLQIKHNHPLCIYFDSKKTNTKFNHLENINIREFEHNFIQQFEEKIEKYPNFQKIYSYYKLENRLPEKKIIIKKTKI